MSQYDSYSRDALIQRIEELEKQQTLKRIKTIRERFADQILRAVPDRLSILDREGRLAEWISSSEVKHPIATEHDPVGQELHKIIGDEAAEILRKELDNAFESGKETVAYHGLDFDGDLRDYESRIFPLDAHLALCMSRDITDSKQAQTRLSMLQYAINNIDEEIYACTTDGAMVYANKRFCIHHNITEEITRHKIYEFWSYKATPEQWQERLEKIRSGNGMYEYTVRLKDTVGKMLAWDIMAYLVYDHCMGREIAWFFGRDVSQRIEQEHRVNQMNSILNSVLNNIPVQIFVKDPANDFRFLYWNKAFEEVTGIPAKEAIGKTDFEVFTDKTAASAWRADDLKLLQTGETLYGENAREIPGQGIRIFKTLKVLAPIEGRLPLIVCILWDVTEQKAAEQQIVDAKLKAEHADQLKSAFLANMSHEIRTPLNAIIGFSQLIVTAEDEEEKQQYADIINTNAGLLLQLITDILDISKIEAGTLEFRYNAMNLNDLCRSEYEVLKSRVQEGVELVFEKKYDTAEIVCDQNRLAQVITNLITNASKFTTKGSIRFGFGLRDDRVEFYVKDTGIGIEEEKRKKVFDRFVKLNDIAAGSGLGLAISKMIVEHMGGEISVDSVVGEGSTFTFWVPRECQ